MKNRVLSICLLISLALLSGLKMAAAPVSPSKAIDVASKVLNDDNGSGKLYGALQIVWTGNEPATKAADNPPFYVVASMTGGFVIVAGDDNVRPVLALSEYGHFAVENMPDNVKWWMDGLSAYVRSVTEPTAEVNRLWASYMDTKAGGVITGTVTDKVEHLTPEWNQGNTDPGTFGKYVYNKYCPQQGGVYSVTGCVATALAEILTVHSGLYPETMPKSGTGKVGGYAAEDGCVTPEEYELGTVYDWSGLRTLTNTAAVGKASEALQNNLARLLADCGAMVEAQYSVNGTGAFSSMVINGAAEHLGYNKRAHMENPVNYSSTQWERMLIDELNQRPMYYAGNGHAFVFDGHGTYDGSPVFHVNFGWGGYCNGYYYYYNLDTGSSNFSEDYGEAIFDFYPDPESTYAYQLTLGTWWGGTGFVGPDVIPVGENFYVYCRGISNQEAVNYSGTVRVNLADKNGAVKVAGIGSFNCNLEPSYGYPDIGISCVIPAGTSIALGDKLVLECTTDEGGTVFGPVVYPTNGKVVGELPMMPSAFIHKEANYSVGDYFGFLLQNNNFVYYGTTWKITYPSGETISYPQSEGMIRLTTAGTYTIVAEIRLALGSAVKESIATKITVH